MVFPARAALVTPCPVTEVMLVPPPKTLKFSTIVLAAGAALWSRSRC
jgi:hypothetical protein